MTNRGLAQAVMDATYRCHALAAPSVNELQSISSPTIDVPLHWTSATIILRLAMLDTRMLYEAPND
jgi:hypothetical protein